MTIIVLLTGIAIGWWAGVIIACLVFLYWHDHLNGLQSIVGTIGSLILAVITGVWGTIMFAFGKE